MSVDMIRCPGCGVIMDLSTFETRPSQVICPVCDTTSIVPAPLTAVTPSVVAVPDSREPLAPSFQGNAPVAYQNQAQQGAFAGSVQAPMQQAFDWQAPSGPQTATSQLGSTAAQPPYDPQGFAGQSQAHVSQPAFGSFEGAAPRFGYSQEQPYAMPSETSSMAFDVMPPETASMAFDAMPAERAAAIQGAMPADNGYASFKLPVQANAPASSQAAFERQPELQSQEKFNEFWNGMDKPKNAKVNIPSKDISKPLLSQDQAKPRKARVLEIDKRGNAEGFAFSLIGLVSVVFAFPPLGLALCIAGLLMNREEKSHGFTNQYAKATSVVAIMGIIVNCLVLMAEILVLVTIAVSPAMLGSYL